jgi:hypothetical protein
MGLMMERTVKTGEEGFILVFTLLLLVVVTLLGVSSIDTSVFESAMSANDALYKQAFFEADGGTNVAGILIEENVSCPNGFTANTGADALILGNVLVQSTGLKLWANPIGSSVRPTDLNRAAYFYYDAVDGGTSLPHTNITVGATTALGQGTSLISNAGYEGAAKNVAGGGANSTYNVFSQHIGNRQSESIVTIRWRHVIGLQGNCKY